MIGNIAKLGMKFLAKHSASIATGVGTGLLLAAGIEGIRKTPKAIELLEEAQYEKHYEKGEDLTPMEKCRCTARIYIPVFLMMAVGTGLIVFGQYMHYKVLLGTIATATMYRDRYDEYVETEKELYGEEHHKAVENRVAEKRIASLEEDLLADRKGDIWYDKVSGRKFVAFYDEIFQAINFANAKIIKDGYISLNEFYDILGCEELTPVGYGEDMGWDLQRGLIQLVTGEIVIGGETYQTLSLDPRYGYDR